ncbi:MAG: fibronectin type III domain-containing protein [Paludibacteraceae bacterium]|nr:fibronectin type III domain-containing protein [Paludibacteraceae bacterium]
MIKRTLLLLTITTLEFFSVYANYNYVVNTKETIIVTLISDKLDWGIEVPVTGVNMEIKSSAWIPDWVTNPLVITTSKGDEIYNDLPANNVYTEVNKYFAPVTLISGIKFEDKATSASRYYRNVSISIAETSVDLDNTVLNTYTTTSFKVLSNTELTTKNLVIDGCEDMTLESVVRDGKTNIYTVTVGFLPLEVKDYSAKIYLDPTQVMAKISGKGILASPTNVNVLPKYDNVTITWSDVYGATSYEVTNTTLGTSKTITEPKIVWDGLNMGTEYKFSVKAKAGDYTSPGTIVSATTLDMPAVQDFAVDGVSYYFANLSWSPVVYAWGYKIYWSDTESIIIEGENTVNATISGLKSGTEYTFTIVPLASETSEGQHTATATATTRKVNCTPETVDNFTLKPSLLNLYTDSKEIATKKNSPIISFSFKRDKALVSTTITVYELNAANEWVSMWSTQEASGNANIALSRNTRNIKIEAKGTKDVSITNVVIEQGAYLETDSKGLSFDAIPVGESQTLEFTVDYSSMSDIVYSDTDEFTVSESEVGEDNCGYGSQTVYVTFAPTEQGEFSGIIHLGLQDITVSGIGDVPTDAKEPVKDAELIDVTYTNLMGRQLNGQFRGVNIVKRIYSDGTIETVKEFH